MKKLISFVLGLMLLITLGCATHKNVDDVVFGSSIKIDYSLTVNKMQIDSICTVDTLPNFNTWISARFTDYETNKVFLKRMYIKQYNDDYEIVYILVGDCEPYKITKRIRE